MPYLTPDEIPEGDKCRPLFIPDSTAWLAIVSGALTELTQKYNWEQFGAVTVDQAVAAMETLVNRYYSDLCGDCNLPIEGAPTRIAPSGEWQEWDGTDWVEPTGDRAIPPVPARPEPTSEERRCLAAKNAALVMEELYEQAVDYWNANVDPAAAFTAWIGVGSTKIMLALGFLSAGVGAFLAALWGTFYAAIEFVSSDEWTAEFDNKFRCMLLDCAVDNAGVVTFDWNCVLNRLLVETNWLDPFLGEQKLAIQIMWMLSQIGADGLNLAGATTAITDADCSFCEPDCSGEYNFTIDEQGWSVDVGRGDYVTGQYFESETYTNHVALTIRLPCEAMSVVQNGFWWEIWTSNPSGVQVQTYRQSNNTLIRTIYTTGSLNTGGAWSTRQVTTSGFTETEPFYFVINCTSALGAVVRIRQVNINQAP